MGYFAEDQVFVSHEYVCVCVCQYQCICLPISVFIWIVVYTSLYPKVEKVTSCSLMSVHVVSRGRGHVDDTYRLTLQGCCSVGGRVSAFWSRFVSEAKCLQPCLGSSRKRGRILVFLLPVSSLSSSLLFSPFFLVALLLSLVFIVFFRILIFLPCFLSDLPPPSYLFSSFLFVFFSCYFLLPRRRLLPVIFLFIFIVPVSSSFPLFYFA